MNFQDCVDILNKRATKICDKKREKDNPESVEDETQTESEEVCPCIDDPHRPKIDFCQVCQPEKYKLSENLETEAISQLSDLRLIELCFQIQQNRFQAYKKYDATLVELLETSQIQDYPDLCKQMTEIFNDLSKSILAIKEEALRRIEGEAVVNRANTLKKVAATIQQLQIQEREKLLVVASIHLHTMQDYLPNVKVVTGGKSEIHENYYAKKMQEISEKIVDAHEELQALKIDLIELNE